MPETPSKEAMAAVRAIRCPHEPVSCNAVFTICSACGHSVGDHQAKRKGEPRPWRCRVTGCRCKYWTARAEDEGRYSR